eukprot:gene14410-5464_t
MHRSLSHLSLTTCDFAWCFLLVLFFAEPAKSHVENYLEATICDGSSKRISCPQTQDIHILQTFYGKWRNHDCHGPLAVKDNILTCHVERPKSTAIIRDICQGKNNCELYADKTIFGDPCSKLSKYLYVTYFCLPSHSRKKTQPSRSISNLLANVSPGEVRGFLRQNIEKDQTPNEGAAPETEFPETLDDMPGSEDLLNSPLIKVIRLASEELYPPNIALHSAKVCNGESRTLACKPQQRIKINNAFYGKKSGQDCHGSLPYKDESPTCSALDAKYNVQRFCEGRRFCLVHADDTTYGRSLCPNINKYLHVTYFCEEPTDFKARSSVVTPQVDYEEDAVTRSEIKANDDIPRTIRVCNGHRKTISCTSKSKTMQIHHAFYGKRNGQDCRGHIRYRDSVADCIKNTAFDSVNYLCNGRQSCDLAAEHALFGEDPCPGVNKYLEVKYSC